MEKFSFGFDPSEFLAGFLCLILLIIQYISGNNRSASAMRNTESYGLINKIWFSPHSLIMNRSLSFTVIKFLIHTEINTHPKILLALIPSTHYSVVTVKCFEIPVGFEFFAQNDTARIF